MLSPDLSFPCGKEERISHQPWSLDVLDYSHMSWLNKLPILNYTLFALLHQEPLSVLCFPVVFLSGVRIHLPRPHHFFVSLVLFPGLFMAWQCSFGVWESHRTENRHVTSSWELFQFQFKSSLSVMLLTCFFLFIFLCLLRPVSPGGIVVTDGAL